MPGTARAIPTHLAAPSHALALREESKPMRPRGRIPRVARLLALAHHFEELLDTGAVETQAEFAELTKLTPVRVTQIMNLPITPQKLPDCCLVALSSLRWAGIPKLERSAVRSFAAYPNKSIRAAMAATVHSWTHAVIDVNAVAVRDERLTPRTEDERNPRRRERLDMDSFVAQVSTDLFHTVPRLISATSA